jgi:hypothetical protein
MTRVLGRDVFRMKHEVLALVTGQSAEFK